MTEPHPHEPESPDELARRVRDHYAAQHASDALKARVAQAATQPHASSAKTEAAAARRRRLAPPALALAAAIAIAAATWLVVSSASERQLHRTIAAEIALNHRKAYAADVQTSDLAALPALMPKLDFTPVAATHPDAADLRLIGARYCSIDDAVAAQLNYLDPDGRPCTMYQARADQLPRIQDRLFQLDGATVRIWTQDGVLIGLARSTPASP
ncbi:MAG: hypothetical protein AAGA57_06135 [Planctomycetota bacterium]